MTRENYLKSLISDFGTRKDFAKKIGMPYSTLLSILKNVGGASVDNIIKICNGLGITSDDLADFDKQETTPTAIYPYFDTAISAGALEAVDAIDSAVRIEVPDAIMGRYAHHKDIVFLKVNGESMNRVIPNGSIIAVQTDIEKESLSNGDIVVAYTAEGYSVKRLFLDRVNHRAILRPDSTDISFSDIVVDCSSYAELHIFGKVVIYSVVL